MLSKKHRGLKASEVNQLFRGLHQSASNRFYRILWCPSTDGDARFVVITSTKLHKSAVVRNRYRRAVYDMVRLFFSNWTDGVRIAILVKTSALQATKKELEESLYDMMKKSGLVH